MLDHFQGMIPEYVTRSYRSGSSILSQGDKPQTACVVLSGVVRTFNISEYGEEQTINFHVEGEFFPSSWIFDKAPTCIYFYEAMTDVRICFIPKERLLESFEASEASRSLLTDYLANSYTASQLRIAALEQPRAQDKIVLSFYYLSQRLGDVQPDGNIKIGPHLTHQAIASLVGVTRETASTELHKLKEKHILHYQHQEFSVNMTALMQHIAERGFESLPLKTA